MSWSVLSFDLLYVCINVYKNSWHSTSHAAYDLYVLYVSIHSITNMTNSSGWCLGTLFFHILGISSSQLTNSYFFGPGRSPPTGCAKWQMEPYCWCLKPQLWMSFYHKYTHTCLYTYTCICDPYGSLVDPLFSAISEDCPAGQINIEEWTGPDLTEYNELATKRVPQPNCVLTSLGEATNDGYMAVVWKV